MATSNTNGLVAAQEVSPDVAKRLFVAIAQRAVEDALCGRYEAELWLDEHVSRWREPLDAKQQLTLEMHKQQRENCYTSRLSALYMVQSWLRYNDTYQLVIEYSPIYRLFYAEMRVPCPDNPEDWLLQAGAKHYSLELAIEGLGKRLQKLAKGD